jgi:periplasmic protein TonB
LKPYFVISVVLHALAIIIALFLLSPEKEKEPKPFIARIVTPEELARKPEIKPPPARRERGRRFEQNIRTGETNTPKVFSAIKKGASGGRQSAGDTTDRQSRASTADRRDNTLVAPPKPVPNRDKLFDRDVIGKIAHAGAKRQTTSIKGGGVSADIGNVGQYGWIQRVIEKISVAWVYPRELLERRIFADVDVLVTFRQDGEIGNMGVVRTSGYKILDDSALKALKDAAPYWPLPDDIGKEVSVKFHFYVP